MLKWLAALVVAVTTVGAGTALSTALTGPGMSTDLNTRASAALGNESLGWAKVEFEGRDAVVRGFVTDPAAAEEAVTRLAALHGVRSVVNAIDVAPLAAPYPFAATVADGKVALSGGAPDDAVRSELVALAGAGTNDLQLLSGAPDKATWRAAIGFALNHLQYFDEGKVELSDLSVSISGRAKSPEAYDALRALRERTPAGVDVAALEIAPPLASPFTWSAEKSADGAVIVAGHVPDEAVAYRLSVLMPTLDADRATIAGGAPADFEAEATAGLTALFELDSGSVSFDGQRWHIAGRAGDAQQAFAAEAAFRSDVQDPAAWTYDVLLPPTRAADVPPIIADYRWSVQKLPAGTIALTGYVPNPSLKAFLAAHADGAHLVDEMRLGLGEPKDFAAAALAGIDAVLQLDEGEFGFSHGVWSLTGRTTDDALPARLMAQLAPGTHVDVDTPGAEETATPAAYVWAAEKAPGGGIALSGFVPNDGMKRFLAAHVTAVADSTEVAPGAPASFAADVLAALDALAQLSSGSVRFDGTRWSLTGASGSPQQRDAALAALARAATPQDAWILDLADPGPEPQVAVAPEPQAAVPAEAGQATAGSEPSPLAAPAPLANPMADGVAPDTAQTLDLRNGEVVGGTAEADAAAAVTSDSAAAQPSIIAVPATSTTPAVATTTPGSDTIVSLPAPQAETVAALPAPTIEPEQATTPATPTVAATEPGPAAVTVAEPAPDAIAATEPAPAVEAATEAVAATEPGPAAVTATEPDALTATEPTTDVAAATEPVPETQPAAPATEAATEPVPDGGVVPGPVETEVAVQPETEAAPAPTQETAAVTATEPEPVPATEAAVAVAEPTPEAVQTAEQTAALAAVEPAPEPVAEPAPDTQVAALPEPVPVPAPEPKLPTKPVIPETFVFDAKRADSGPIAITGPVPADASRRYFGVIAGGVPTEGMTVADTLPADFIPHADAGLRALQNLDDGTLGFDGTHWYLTGIAKTEDDRAAAMMAIANVPDWTTDIALTPPIDICRDTVASFSASHTILFQSGSAKIVNESADALGELASDLQVCPAAAVYVEGHTDADGDDNLNLALSVSRAEAVVDALIQLGIGEERLYAVGYGESLPIASNDTTAGKAANRRIVFTIVEEGQ